MHGVAFALVVFLGLPAAPPDPEALVEQLGSPRFAPRELAGVTLVGLGRAALPALRAARASRDVEIRARASAILDRVEGDLLVRPTMITLDFRDVTIAEAVRAIRGRTGLPVDLPAEGDSAWSGRKITLEGGRSLPFWEAMDALCKAGGVHHRFETEPTQGQAGSAFSIFDGDAPTPEPVSDSGPFRVHLASVHYQSEVLLSRPRPGSVARGLRPTPADHAEQRPAASSKQFYFQLLVTAEPGLAIASNGSVRVIEASDDLGRSIVVSDRTAAPQTSSGDFGLDSSPQLRLRVDLARLEEPGRRIKRVKGVIPVVVSARKADPLVVPVGGAPGKTYSNGDVTIGVREFRPAAGNRPAILKFSLRDAVGAGRDSARGDGELRPYRPESPQQQLEVVDAEGRTVPWFPSGSLHAGDETRLTLTLLPGGTAGVPASVRYHGIIRGEAEIPFEFRDIPMP